MAVNGDHLEMIDALRKRGVIHYKGDKFEVTLGYPFEEAAPAKTAKASEPQDAFRVEHAADLVLNPPNLAMDKSS